MCKFTTLFLLALAMTIGANQAFAQENTGSPNEPGKQERPDPRDDNDDDGAEDDDDPLLPVVRRLISVDDCSPTHGFGCDEPPPRRRKPKKVVVQKEPEDCGCKHKTVRVSGRFVTVVDCYYQTISVNGRPQTLYCTKDD